MPDPLQMLREDHQKVKELFKEFEAAESDATKRRICQTVIKELEVHSQIEEEIFYPAVGRGSDDTEDILAEAEEEHHVADLLMAELKTMRGGGKSFEAKFTVLAENVKHHIQEEESEMLPKAAEIGREKLNRIGEEMARRKQELMAEVPMGGRPAGKRPAARKPATKPAARKRTTTTASRGAAGRTAAASRGGRTTARKTEGAARRTTRATTRGTSTRRTTRASAGTRTSGTRTTAAKRGTATRSGTTRRTAARAATTARKPATTRRATTRAAAKSRSR